MSARRLVWSVVVRAWEQVWGAQWCLCVLRERAAYGWDDRAVIWGRRGERVVCVRVGGSVLAGRGHTSLPAIPFSVARFARRQPAPSRAVCYPRISSCPCVVDKDESLLVRQPVSVCTPAVSAPM